jgi:predicted TIM-barrel fold metal-dependent hydrolase
MWRFEFAAWEKMVYDAIKSCEHEKLPLYFIKSSNPRVWEAEQRIIRKFPKLHFVIEEEGDIKK